MPETTTIQQEISDLEHQLNEKMAALEKEKAGSPDESHASEKEVFHEMIGDKIKEHAPEYKPAPPSSKRPHKEDEPSYVTEELRDKVDKLVKTVFDNNMEEGIREAVNSHNPAVIDAFHDMLHDELYDKLVEKRKIEKLN